MDTRNPALQIRSEVGPLKTILLHRPGGELERLIPKYLDEMLFEDIPYLAQMQIEHDRFAEVLRANGAEVLYFEELLADILEIPEVKETIIGEITAILRVNSALLREDIRVLLAGMVPRELTATLLSGLSKKEVTHSEAEKRLSFYIKDEYPSSST